MIDVLLAKYRPHAERIKLQIDSILAQKDVAVNLMERDDAIGEGPAANFSKLLAMSRADYVAFSDQDDVWEPQKLSCLMAKMREMEIEEGNNVPLLVFCDSVPVDDNLKPICSSSLAWQKVDVHGGLGFSRLLMQNFIAGNTMLFNAALRKKAGQIPAAALMHDSWIALVAAAFGRIGFVSEPLVKYRQHPTNMLGTTKAVVPIMFAGELRDLLHFVIGWRVMSVRLPHLLRGSEQIRPNVSERLRI